MVLTSKRFMKTILNLFIAFCMIFMVNCSSNDSDEPNGPEKLAFKKTTNVSYGPDTDQVYDIYLPEGRTSETKVMILVHGGGWSSGDKSSMNYLVDLYRNDFPNLALVNMNYRLSDQNNPPYPMQTDDITSVINDLKAKKTDYVISEDYGFLGASAGGHLSLLWSYAFDTDNDVNMVCSIVGPTNFLDPAYTDNTDPLLQELLNAYGLNPTTEYLREASPLYQVTSAAPPTILFYGGQDPLVPASQGTAMRDKLIELNVTQEFTLYPEAGHGWGASVAEIPLLLDTWAKIKAFTTAHL